MALPLSEILAEHWPGYVRANRSRLASAHYRAVQCALACRTAEMGGRVHRCATCKSKHFAYFSCNHRNCAQCGALDQQIWTARQEARLLPTPYFMVTFTIPDALRSLARTEPKILYNLLLKESAGALRDLIATKYKGGVAGLISVLHTWGRQIQHHPHVHCIVPAVALDPNAEKIFVPNNKEFLVHFRPLAERFRSRMSTALKEQHPDLFARISAMQPHALCPDKTWNVQLQHVGSGRTALRYLARYVRRSAFSPKRLLGYDTHGNILLRWTSSSTGKSAVMRLHPHEFIRRWLLHVLPKGLVRIRYYGFLASAALHSRLRLRLLLGELGEPEPVLPELKPFDCPHCGGELVLFGSFFHRSRPTRGPPLVPSQGKSNSAPADSS